MSPKYAKDQPEGFTNRIERVAIVGAGGSVGKHIARELLQTGKHTVTALTRADSSNVLPEGVHAVQVDYNDESTLVSALQNQQFLIITMNVMAPPDTQSKLIQAAAKAGVPYVMPNSYGVDVTNNTLSLESMTGEPIRRACAEIEAAGVSKWMALVCGFWYEFSMVTGAEWFGFDFAARKMTFYDDGETKINVSTWEQCGRALAGLLSLKELPDDENDRSHTVSGWSNKPVFIASFLVSQKDMFESWKRVTGESDADWKIEYEPTAERYKRGLERMQQGDRRGFAQAMYARVFYPSDPGNHERVHGLDNEALGLLREDLDECTKNAKTMLESGYSYF
ncbi:aromatic alcohol reductase [Aspergillus clavatus NRRL 1]|uniref:Oxidoreductase CipA, putative n=1 Tax=Aspergillus clavatus (strain ATCC 1007 / CBS 513.65 / DSM 816 / NCTC 3887 / NRRL 1 / QM 1276 / 107) TaxID=344612 RepID=A1CSC9_ASPCL|nr:oxidoreductase CipA, putative [Aspergillus clavatus NRRL 1]EAW08550.1 oxidoreductase CipA, putative [Aspergillus clavatus NRRL 1]